MARRSFKPSAGRWENPPEFDFGESDTPEVFHCREDARIPAGVALLSPVRIVEAQEAARAGDAMTEAQIRQVAQIGQDTLRFFQSILTDDSYGRLVARLDDPRDVVTAEQLNDVQRWLYEELGKGPQPVSNGSSPSPSSGGPSSTETALSEV
jgi:hypothetical protein